MNRALRLAEAQHQERAERLLVARPRVEAAETQQRAQDAQAVARTQVRVAEDRESARSDDRRRPVPVDHGQREPRAPHGGRLTDLVEECEVLAEAAERDVLAVVGRRLRIVFTLRKRLHGAAQSRTRLEQRDVVTVLQQLERRSEARQTTSDDNRLQRRSPSPTMRSFVNAERCGGSSNTSNPADSMRSSVARESPA